MPLRAQGEFVLYWMIANRRTRWNFALEHAANLAKELQKPLLVLEALRANYPWKSERFDRFVLEGMSANAESFAKTPVTYFPYVETKIDSGKGLLQGLSRRACAIVTDEFPCFFLPRMVEAAAQQVDVRLETVDSNGLLPLRSAQKDFPTAYAFRRFLQKELPKHLQDFPQANPLARLKLPRLKTIPKEITQRWKPAVLTSERGGENRANQTLASFLQKRFDLYAEHGNEPQTAARSSLSPFLHFGHISSHEIFTAITKREHWQPRQLSKKAHGKRAGWWNLSANAELFLDELITWRELGYNFCFFRRDYDRFESLPAWARATLEKHAKNKRGFLYSLEEFENSQTHDPLWNAAQNQLRREGTIHNYLRMLWGKKILEWSRSPQEALQILIELNNRYALDGRNPNSYTGIFWVLGRFDRPWGPERPVFGTVRYMSSENTARKYRVEEYMRLYNAPATESNSP